jgi:hypothetical protein
MDEEDDVSSLAPNEGTVISPSNDSPEVNVNHGVGSQPEMMRSEDIFRTTEIDSDAGSFDSFCSTSEEDRFNQIPPINSSTEENDENVQRNSKDLPGIQITTTDLEDYDVVTSPHHSDSLHASNNAETTTTTNPKLIYISLEKAMNQIGYGKYQFYSFLVCGLMYVFYLLLFAFH